MTCCISDDGPRVFREEWLKARKPYQCCECWSPIVIGVKYQKVTGLWDDFWDTFRTCEKCAGLRQSLSEVSCPMYGALSESFQEYLSSGRTLMEVKPGTHAAKLVTCSYIANPDRGE